MDDSHQPLRAAQTQSHSHSNSNSQSHSHSHASQAPDDESPKVFRPSLFARLCCCLRLGRSGGGGLRSRSNSASSALDLRHSSVAAVRTPEQIVADKHLKKQIDKYSTMRVHMKRVQFCLEQEKRNKFYRELVIYLVFLVVVMGSLLSLPVHFPYEQNAALTDLFFDEEFRNISIKKTFQDAMIEDELWQWVDGPFVEGYYELPIRNMRRIGSAVVRSGRVEGDLCRYTDGRTDFVLFSNEFCYPEFTQQVELRRDYGDANTTKVLGQPYTWYGDLGKLLRSQTFTPTLFNHEMDYGDGGYAVFLPRDNETAAKTAIKQLKKDFLTDSSRYFSVSFAFYNPRSDIFTHIQGLFEMSDTDYMETTARVKSFRILQSYKDVSFLWVNWFVVVLVLATLWLLGRELSDVRVFGFRRYLQSLWNLLDMLQLVLLIIFLQRWVSYMFMCEEIRAQLYRVARMDCSGPINDQETARDCFVDVEPLAWRFLSVTNYAAALALVSVAIVFKYLRLNTRLNLLWRTLRFAAKDLLAFVVIFFVIFFAYAIMGFLTFGSSVRQYHSLSVSLTSCFQMLLGAFDYNQIYEANPAMAGLFFFSFMVSVYLICVNMFIAIMSEYYSLAQAEKKKFEQHKRLVIGTNLSETPGDGAGGGGSGDGGDDDKNNNSKLGTHGDEYMDVEYDLAKQVQNYLQGLRVSVRVPPRKDKSSIYETEQVLLSGYQRVLLVDYDYLMAERKRLKLKFRAWVHSVVTVTFLMRLVRPDFRMEVDRSVVVDKRPRASSAASSGELAEFPVTYVPISSKFANTVALLHSLKKGMVVDMDDGSLTKDQITLEVLGGQSAYLPPRYKRRDVAIGVAASTNGDRISEHDHDHDDQQQQHDDDDDATTGINGFGLRHHHQDIGGASHIRCCRVLYDGDTVLDGLEACILPRRVWAVYFMRHVVWGSIKQFVASLFGRHKHKKNANRLITDADVDLLITEHFMDAPGRGISCRFDELVRNFRMFIAKRAHKKHSRITNLEERIFVEVITFLERFPSALSPLDKRELEGYKYTPQPVDTARVRLPSSVRMLLELLAQNAHEVWAVGRIDQGWRWGPSRDNEKMLHPDLEPYEALTEQTKQYDRDTSLEALKVITALGYVLEPPAHADNAVFDVSFGEPARTAGATYVPKPISTESVKVPAELKSLIELLAENTHEVWAKMRMSQGWKFGAKRDDAKLEHNGLVPYIYLTQEEKQMDRNTALQTVKLILRCGFTFVHRDKRSASHRSARKNKSSRGDPSAKVFGRNENPESKNVSDAVALARSTARAKRAFLKNGTGSMSQRTLTSMMAASSLSSAASAASITSSTSLPATIEELHTALDASASSSSDAETHYDSMGGSGGSGGAVPVLQRAETMPPMAVATTTSMATSRPSLLSRSSSTSTSTAAAVATTSTSPIPDYVDQISTRSSSLV